MPESNPITAGSTTASFSGASSIGTLAGYAGLTADVNGDGLTDLIKDGTVIFQSRSGGATSFTGGSADATSPVVGSPLAPTAWSARCEMSATTRRKRGRLTRLITI